MRKLALCSTLFLAACGSSDTVSYKDSEGNDHNITVEDSNGTRTVTSDDGLIRAEGNKGSGKARFPAYAPQYPGATVQTAVDMTVGNPQTGGVQQHIISMVSKDAPDTVIAFYKAKIAASGKPVKVMNSATGPMLTVGGPGPMDAEGYVTAMPVGSAGTSVNVVVQKRLPRS